MRNLLPTTTSAEVATNRPTVAVLPVGSYEQHGKYLPLATDSIIAHVISQSVSDAYGLLCLPPVTIACSHEHSAWPGTVSITSRTLHYVVSDIQASLLQSGIKKLILVNGHGGNYVLRNIVQEANSVRPSCMSLFPSKDDWQHARNDAALETSMHDDMHAGEIETSILLHTFPHVVRSGNDTADHIAERPHLLVHGMAPYTDNGVIGRPSLGTAGKGKTILESLVSSFNNHLQAIA